MRTRVYILAGGLGTRLSHIVKDVPKPMAPIGGKPFLEWQIEWLKKQHFDDIVLLIGHMGDTIEDAFGDGSRLGVHIEYSREKELLGTGGAVIRALNLHETDVFIIINGDTYFDADLRFLAEKVLSSVDGENLYIALKQKDDVGRYGSVVIDDSNRIIGFTEKSSAGGKGLINGGIYAGRKSLLRDFSETRISMETEIFPSLMKQGALYGIPFDGNFIDIGIPEDYYYADRMIGKWHR